MREYKKWELVAWVFILLGIITGIALGIAVEGRDLGYEKTTLEPIAGLGSLLLLVIAGVLYWLLPKTKLGKYLEMNETAFIATNIIGIFCGFTGLLATFLLRHLVVESHLFELLFIIWLLAHVYWVIIVKIKRTTELLDEKQIENIKTAAATTLMLSSFVMLMLYFASYHKLLNLEGMVWFLVYFFTILTIYSSSTIIYFKRA